ncbi:MAG: EAL domain-containing protein, partial [Herbaspirillum sp.]
SPLTISATDLDGRLTVTSRSFQRRVGGVSGEELRGKTIYEALLMQAPPGHELDAFEMAEQIHRQNLQIMMSGEALENVDGPGFLESDRRNWYKINKYPLRDRIGKVVGLLAIAHDITDQHEYQLRVEHQALHDPLTGLPNQRYLLNRLSSAIVQFQTDQQPWAVLFCDLDFFKSINKTHGHEFGDQCLMQLTRRILQQLPPQTLLARFGGDEFMILLPHVSLASTRAQAEAILTALSQPLNIGEIMVKIPASIGIALLSMQHHSPSDLLREVDAAMHQAKEHGRNRVELYDPSLQGSANRQAQMDIALRFAQERDELTLVYQPKVSLNDGSLQGFELLMRWNSPQFGNISPNEFIPLAEASGIVIPLGLWALEQACMQLRRWQLDYPHQTNLIIAVNVSMRQLLQPAFLEQVTNILAENQIIAGCIELELTETSAMANPQQTIETLLRFKKLGLRLALDDFGTGYSSLAYLQRLPLDVLKIDKAFVHGIGTNQSDTEIVNMILALAKTLKLATVAEGVEQPAQLNKLTELGCMFGQGFIFAHGVPAQQAQEFLEADYRFSASQRTPDHESSHELESAHIGI